LFYFDGKELNGLTNLSCRVFFKSFVVKKMFILFF